MRTAQVTDWQVITHSRALHAFAIPDSDFPELGAQFQPTANRRSWAAMESLFAETLA